MTNQILHAGDSSSSHSSTDLSRRFALVLLGAIIALAIFLRAWRLDDRSMWVDEGHTGYMAQLSLTRMTEELKGGDSGGPLHYAVEHLFISARPYAVWLLRMPPLIASVIAVVLLYALAHQLLGSRWAALAAALALAVNRFHIHHSHEARNYSLYLTLSLAAIYCLTALCATGPGMPEPASAIAGRGARARRLLLWSGFVLAGAGMIYTHNVSFIFLAALLAYYPLATWLRPAGRARWWRPVAAVALAGACIGALYLPWLGVLRAQFHDVMKDCWIPRRTLPEALAELTHLFWIGPMTPHHRVADHLVPADTLARLGFRWSMVCGAVTVFGWVALAWLPRFRRAIVLMLCLAAAVAAVIAFSMVSRPIYMVKVCIPFILVSTLGAGVLLVAMQNLGWRRLAPRVVIVLLAGQALFALLAVDMDEDAEWKQAMAYVLSQAGPNGEPIFVDNIFDLRTVEWYIQGTPYAPVRYRQAVSELLLPGGSARPAAPGLPWPDNVIWHLKKQVQPGSRIWVVARSNNVVDLPITEYLDSIAASKQSKEFLEVRVTEFVAW